MSTDSELGAAENAHSTTLRLHIAQEISAARGWISFDRYMDLALYAPGLGYYSAGAGKLGSAGDFTTAPEVSRLFGVCVAQQCAEILRHVAGGSILEIGAGTGRLAVDVLGRLESLGAGLEHYYILEVSADLRERQQRLIHQALPHLAQRVTWLDAVPSAPFDGVILANEVMDALPVVRFRWSAAGVEELGVVLRDGPSGGFAWAARPADVKLNAAVAALSAAGGGWDDGYVSEYCARLLPWAYSVTAALRRGAALWIDYGLPRSQYYIGERHEGTLLCHFRHRAYDDPFRLVGLQDITAWVDFTQAAEAGVAAGFELGGFTTQAFFLAGLGIDSEMQRLAGGDAIRYAGLANQAKLLMLPGGMGERFKAMAWTRGIDVELTGFALQDLRHTL